MKNYHARSLFLVISQSKCKIRDNEQHKKKETEVSLRLTIFVLQLCINNYTSKQRCTIKLGLQAKMTLSAIAKQICVSVSTISHEIKRNKNCSGGYSWKLAHEMAPEHREVLVHNRLTPRLKLNFSTPTKMFFNHFS